MLGCHHAFMAAGALITAIKNEGSFEISENMLNQVYERTQRQAIGGYCGLTGICGVVPALGACFAVLLGSKCGTDKEQRITMNAVLEIVQAIKDLTGPSCCKAYARKSIEIAKKYLGSNLNVTLSKSNDAIKCKHFKNHPNGCRKGKCPYYDGI